MDNRPIGMFDSGVGGITVFKEVQKAFPNESIIYLGDTAHFPFGNKSREQIISITKKSIDFLVSKNVKLVIIACGTATSQALDSVKSLYSIPIIGIIEPTVKYISKLNSIKKIGVVATAGTIRSNSWKNNLLIENPKYNVINQPCPLLAPLAEEGWIDNNVAKLTIHEYMKDLHDVDALILGCTHYPLFSNLFKAELNDSALILNTGVILANYIKDSFSPGNTSSNSVIYLTDVNSNFINVATSLCGDLLPEIKELS